MDLKTPFNVQKGDNGLHYTYLDTVGRPVIVAYKNNLVEEHIQDFEVFITLPFVYTECFMTGCRVSKLGNIHNQLSKLIEKPFSINHRLLIKCNFRQISACFFTTTI